RPTTLTSPLSLHDALPIFAHQEDAILSDRGSLVPERADRGHRPDHFRISKLRAEGLDDLPVARFEPAAELAHALLITEQSDHPLVARDRALIDLQASIERDAHPR